MQLGKETTGPSPSWPAAPLSVTRGRYITVLTDETRGNSAEVNFFLPEPGEECKEIDI